MDGHRLLNYDSGRQIRRRQAGRTNARPDEQVVRGVLCIVLSSSLTVAARRAETRNDRREDVGLERSVAQVRLLISKAADVDAPNSFRLRLYPFQSRTRTPDDNDTHTVKPATTSSSYVPRTCVTSVGLHRPFPFPISKGLCRRFTWATCGSPKYLQAAH